MRKVHFPRLVIPLSVVLTTYLNFVLNFLAVVIFVLASGIEPRWSWFEIFPLILGLGVLSAGIGTMLSALFVRYRDVQPIWDVALQISFYGSPILYPIETIPDERLQHLIMCNPLAVIVQQARHAIIDPGAPSAAAAIGGAPRLLIPLAIAGDRLRPRLLDLRPLGAVDRRGTVTCAPARSSPRRSCRTPASWLTRSARRR